MGKIRPATVLGLAILAAAACGRKGPILEPLTRIPQPVASLAAGQCVDRQAAPPNVSGYSHRA